MSSLILDPRPFVLRFSISAAVSISSEFDSTADPLCRADQAASGFDGGLLLVDLPPDTCADLAADRAGDVFDEAVSRRFTFTGRCAFGPRGYFGSLAPDLGAAASVGSS